MCQSIVLEVDDHLSSLTEVERLKVPSGMTMAKMGSYELL